MRKLEILSIFAIAGLITAVQFVWGQSMRDGIRQRLEERKAAQNAEYSTETIPVGDTTRTYLIHRLPSYKKSKRLPLVLVFHGGNTPAERMITYTGMNAIADREGFIVVYPRGTNNFWNDGRERAPKVDDVGFIRTLIAQLEKSLNVDPRRIYAAGLSNGGMMAQRLACELSGKLAAIASLAASMPENIASQCRPSSSISVLMIHGTEDPLVPYRGGPLSPASNIGGKVWPVADTIRYWAKHDKCSDKPNFDYLADKDQNDSTLTKREKYVACSNTTDVVLLTVEGGGHTWPGANQYLPERLIGRTSRDFDGSEVIWNFFKQHSTK